LNFVFTSGEVNRGIWPQCVFFVDVLTHSSLKSAELRQHLESKVLNTLINPIWNAKTSGKVKLHWSSVYFIFHSWTSQEI